MAGRNTVLGIFSWPPHATLIGVVAIVCATWVWRRLGPGREATALFILVYWLLAGLGLAWPGVPRMTSKEAGFIMALPLVMPFVILMLDAGAWYGGLWVVRALWWCGAQGAGNWVLEYLVGEPCAWWETPHKVVVTLLANLLRKTPVGQWPRRVAPLVALWGQSGWPEREVGRREVGRDELARACWARLLREGGALDEGELSYLLSTVREVAGDIVAARMQAFVELLAERV